MDLQGANLPTPRFRTGPLPPELSRVQGYKNLQTFFPTLTKLFRLGKWNSGQEIWMDNHWKITGIDCSGTTGPCLINVCKNCDISGDELISLSAKRAFLKTTHLLDPIQWIRGEYSLPKHNGLPWHRKAWQKAWQKLQDPGNKAYVETVAAYAVGRLREEGLTPHFPIFYGAFCAQADMYRYNLTDDFQSYRHERWFWKGYHKGLFKFQILNNETSIPETGMLDELLKAYETIDQASSSDSESELDELSVYKAGADEAGSIKSADSMSDASFAEESDSDSGSETETATDSEHESADSDESENLTYTIYSEFENFPVMLILMEQSEGTMDSLFDNADAVGAVPGTADWENRWAAWIFQIIAGLCCIQTMLGFTHNDLHTNNIVWSQTDEPYIYYKSRAGAIFRIPTFGKIFRIIDYGRSIFRINKQLFISDDFRPGNDAAEQYYFKPLVQKFETEIRPNPSFDLCRLAVSMIDGIFPTTPEKKEGGAVLSDEPGLRVDETVSKLYNMVWGWMIDDEGRNIFIDPDGSERFPDFDLYKHIARYIHKAVPAQQIQNPAFDGFQITEKEIPKDQKVYSLFC